MDRKLIFLDIDGTLVASMAKPSRLTREAVQSVPLYRKKYANHWGRYPADRI